MAIAYAALNTVLGLPVETLQKVAGELADERFETINQEEFVRLALLQRPDYLRAGFNVLSIRRGWSGQRESISRGWISSAITA